MNAETTLPGPDRGVPGLLWAIAQTIILGLGFTYLFAAASLFFFDALPGAIFPVAVGGGAAASFWQARSPYPQRGSAQLAGTAAAVLLLFLCPPLVARWFDGSFDGLWYHQHSILQLVEGWNPLRGEPPAEVPRPVSDSWVAYYPKGSWIIGAVLTKFFGTIEAAKSINLLAALAAGCATTALLLTPETAARSTFIAAAAGIGVAANPVVLAQLHSSYVDGVLVSTLLLAIIASVRQARAPGVNTMLVLVFSIAVCANLKVIGVAYLGIGLVVVYVLYLVLRHRAALRSVVIAWTAGLVLGVGVLGADPYVRNTINHGHPFYPLFGTVSAYDWPSSITPLAFHEMGWEERFVRSIFAAPKNTLGGFPAMRLPVTVTPEDILQLANYDLRIGGFGPLFGGALVLSVVLLIWMPRSGTPLAVVLWGAFVFVLVTVRINPEGWWARYVPQLWWLPWIVIAGVAMTARGAVPRAIAFAAAVILVLNAALMAGASLGHSYLHTEKQRHLIDRLKAGQAAGGTSYYIYFGPYEGIAHRYAAAGIRYTRVRSVTELPCANPENLGGPAPVMRMCRSADAGPARKAE